MRELAIVIFHEELGKAMIPELKYVDAATAKDNHAFIVVRNTLTRLGQKPKKASFLAGSNRGTPRERLFHALRELEI